MTLKKLLAILLTGIMCVSLVACTTDSTEDTGTDTSDDGTATTDGEVTFTYAVGGEPDVLDPATVGDSVTSAIAQQLYLPLFYITEDGSTANGAVESYEISEDGLTYTFNLIENNYWSDGQQVVAEDYVYNIKRAVGYGAEDSYYAHYITDFIAGGDAYVNQRLTTDQMGDLQISAPDDFTIVMTLKQPAAHWVSVMAGSSVFYPVRQDYALELNEEWAQTVGYPTNGAFKLVSFDSTTEYVMEKNEYYAFADDVTVDNLVAKIITDQDAQLLAFQNGEVDYADSLATSVTKIYEGQPELIVPPSVINYYVNMNINDKDGKLDDVNVRRALQLALNRDEIVLALDGGDIYYPLHGLVPNNLPGITSEGFREEADAEGLYVYYDLEEAKALLSEAGYSESNKLELEYYYNQSSFHDLVSQIMQAQWEATGMIDVELKTGEIRTFFQDRTDGLFELARNAFSADYMDVSNYLDLGDPSKMSNVTWGDETYTAMLQDAAAQTDTTVRLEKYHEAEQYLIEEMAYANPVIGYSTAVLVKAGTEGVIYSPQGGATFWYVKVAE